MPVCQSVQSLGASPEGRQRLNVVFGYTENDGVYMMIASCYATDT